MIGPKNDPSPALQEKVLELIQSWADAFRNQPDLSQVYHIYLDLKAKGIEFPAQDLDSMAPIHTPQRSIAPGLSTSPPRNSSVTGTPSRAASNARQDPVSSVPRSLGPIKLSPEQLEKLNHELGIVQGNIAVFEDMLNELTPGQEHADDWELLSELNQTCRGMQNRIMELIDSVVNEDVTIELLRVNDSLNNTFVRYDRFCKKRAKGSPSPLMSSPSSIQPQFLQSRPQENSLIDLDDLLSGPILPVSGATASVAESQLLTDFANMAVNAGKPRPTSMSGDEFDVFAHSRSSVKGSNGASSAYAVGAASAGDQVNTSLGSLAQARPLRDLEQRDDLVDMEKWLMEQESGGATKPSASKTTTKTATVDNSDFERFLYERADNLPSSNQSRQKEKKPESDPFGL